MVNYDVVVVGAGFAGPVAAKKCAEAGLKTLLLERSAKPGQKVISTCMVPIAGFLLGPAFLREDEPPIERAAYRYAIHYVRGGEIFLTMRAEYPTPIGYCIYCQPFCAWEAERAVAAGAELRTSTAAVDVLKKGKQITGVVTDKGDKISSKIVIDAEGSESLLAIKAGIRKKFPADSVELCLLYDFEMSEADVEEVTQGGHMEFYIAMPEEKILAPLGEGTAGVCVIPYRQSLHLTFGQLLAMRNRRAIAEGGWKLIQSYADNFFNIRRWRELIAPKAKLRARMWATAPLYSNLDPEVRAQRSYGDGMLVVGDAGGFMGSATGHGVDTAFISGDIAGDVAIEAIQNNEVSSAFLERFERCKCHPTMHDLCSPRRREFINVQDDMGRMLQTTAQYFFGYDMIRLAEAVQTTSVEDIRKLLPVL